MADYNMICINCGCQGSHVGRPCHQCRQCTTFMRPDVFVAMNTAMIREEIGALRQFVQSMGITLLEFMGELHPEVRKVLEDRRQAEREEAIKRAAEKAAESGEPPAMTANQVLDILENVSDEGEIVRGNFGSTADDESALD
jgi:hypothetical protein